MLVPGTKVHRLLVCRPATQPLKKGQRVVLATENKSRIPLGVLQHLWNLHRQWIQYNDGAHTHCISCGSNQVAQEDQLLLCENDDCRHIQHVECFEMQMEALKQCLGGRIEWKEGASSWKNCHFTCSECRLWLSREIGEGGMAGRLST